MGWISQRMCGIMWNAWNLEVYSSNARKVRSYHMNEFKNIVLTGQVPFKNGSSIICLLLTSKKIDNQGNEKVTGYEVLEVYNYFENEAPIETPEGKRRRQKEKAEKSQMSLLTEEDYK